MYNFSFICRKSKAGKNGLAAIELSIVLNGERAYVSLPQKANPKTFLNDMQSRKNNCLKEYTSSVRLKLNQYINEMMMQGAPITAASIKDYFITGGVKSHTIKRLCDEYLNMYKNKVTVGETAEKTYNKYIIAAERFIEFIGPNVEVGAIKNADIVNFRIWMKREYKYLDTTCSLYLAKLKSIIVYAHNNGYIRTNPFGGIKIGKREREVEYLTADELETIAQHNFIGRLEQVRDLFVFASNTGLSYSDMAQLSKSDIKQSEGVYYVKKPRVKTGIYFTAIINSMAMNILKKYNYNLPIISNQKYNAYLKEIADICGITKPLHSHIARHTAATQMLNKGYSIEILAKILGHSDTRMTAHYAKILDKTVLRTAANLG